MLKSKFVLADDDRCLKTSEVAEYLNISTKTLRTYRADGLGPAFVKFGRMVRYRLSDVKTWRDSRRFNPAEKSQK